MTASAFILSFSVPTALLVCCAIGFCAGVAIFLYGFRLLQRGRLVLATTLSEIRNASIGMVEVSGRAIGPYTMIAPITGNPCHYCRTIVWEWKQPGTDKQWVKVAGESMHVPFFVDDDTGRLLVDPHGAEVDLPPDFRQEFSNSLFPINDTSALNVRNFLARHRVVTGNPIRIEEICIKPGNSLFIAGTLAENPGVRVGPQPAGEDTGTTLSAHKFSLPLNSISPSATNGSEGLHIDPLSQETAISTASTQTQIIRLSPEAGPKNTAEMTQQQKVAAALVRAGISNLDAWSDEVGTEGKILPRVQIMADREERATAEDSQSFNDQSDSEPGDSGFDCKPPVILMKGEINRTFLISWRGRHQVARRLAWKGVLMIWGGTLLALISLYFLLGIKNLLQAL